jgi:hypothetical protein
MGALSWLIHEGAADSVSLAGLAAVLVCRYDDDEPGSPWDHWLFVDDRGDGDQRAALEAILLGRVEGSTIEHFPWVWKPSRLLGVSAAQIEIDHTRSKGWFRVRDRVSVRVAAPVLDQRPVTCVIPGHDRSGSELVVDELQVSAGPISFRFEAVCAYESTFDYAA